MLVLFLVVGLDIDMWCGYLFFFLTIVFQDYRLVCFPAISRETSHYLVRVVSKKKIMFENKNCTGEQN